MLILNELPNWAIELVVAGIGSIFGAIVYAFILLKCKDFRESIKKIVNILLAVIAWALLMYEKIQQGMNELNISFNNSSLFYVAVAVAVVSLVHAFVESTEK